MQMSEKQHKLKSISVTFFFLLSINYYLTVAIPTLWHLISGSSTLFLFCKKKQKKKCLLFLLNFFLSLVWMKKSHCFVDVGRPL